MSLVILCAFLCMVSTQSLSLAHEFTHTEHEPTEFCEILNAIGANKDCTSSQSTLLFPPPNQNHSSIWFVPTTKAIVVLNQRSRAPPPSHS